MTLPPPRWFISAYFRQARTTQLSFCLPGDLHKPQLIYPQRGILQGHPCSPPLFVAAKSYILEDVTSSCPGLGVRLMSTTLQYHCFADDIVVLACSRHDLQLLVRGIAARLHASGFQI